MQEGGGGVEVPEPFMPDRKIFIQLYTENELSSILEQHGFGVLEKNRKMAKHTNEFSYNKIQLITSLT